MAKIMSYIDTGELLWKKNQGSWKDVLLNDPYFNPTMESYSFNTFFRTASDKTLFFATDQFSHGIKIIESTDRNNNFQISIAPINQSVSLPPTPPNLILSSNYNMNSNLEVPFGVPPRPPDGIEVFVYNGYGNDIELNGNFNGVPLNETINPGQPKKIGGQNLTGTLSFSINFSNQFDIASQCMVRIVIKDLHPLIVFVDRKGYTELSLERNNEQPQTINISIEPDNP